MAAADDLEAIVRGELDPGEDLTPEISDMLFVHWLVAWLQKRGRLGAAAYVMMGACGV